MVIFKKYILVAFLCAIFISCSCLAGIAYPKLVYSMSTVQSGYLVSAKDRCQSGRELPNMIAYEFSQPANTFGKQVYAMMLLDKPFKELFIKKMSLKYNNNEYILIKNRKYSIDTSRYYSNGTYFWIWTKNEPFAILRFEKYFYDKRIGDEFFVSFETIFSFEDGVEYKEALEYRIVVVKNRYVPIYLK